MEKLKPVSKRFVICCAAIMFSFTVGSQEYIDVLNRVFDQHAESMYEMEVSYSLYRGMEGKKAYETYSGITAKKGNAFYQQIGPMELLITDTFFVKLHHNDKEIVIGDPKDQEHVPDISSKDLSWLLEQYEMVSFEKSDKLFQIRLKAKPKSSVEIAMIDLVIDRQTYRIKKQTLILSTVQDFSVYSNTLAERDIAIARLEIEYKKLKQRISEHYFEKGRYFSTNGKRIVLGKEFEDFELLKTN